MQTPDRDPVRLSTSLQGRSNCVMAAATESAGALRGLYQRLVLVRPAEEAVIAHQPATCDQLFERKRKLVHVLQLKLLVAAVAIGKRASIGPARAMNVRVAYEHTLADQLQLAVGMTQNVGRDHQVAPTNIVMAAIEAVANADDGFIVPD